MRPLTAFSLAAVTLSLTVFACSASDSSSSSGDSVDTGPEQDITAAKSLLKGAWKASDSADAVDFRPNGEFFRDNPRVLNGVFLPGAPLPVTRQTGHYTVNATSKHVTLHIDGEGTEVLAYDVVTPVMNGVYLPGHTPTRTLTLTQQPAPGSHVAYPSLVLKSADSYCTADADCADERADGTWIPASGAAATSTCDTSKRTCSAGPVGATDAKLTGTWLENLDSPPLGIDYEYTFAADGTFSAKGGCRQDGPGVHCFAISQASGTWSVTKSGPQLGAPGGAPEIVLVDSFNQKSTYFYTLSGKNLSLSKTYGVGAPESVFVKQ